VVKIVRKNPGGHDQYGDPVDSTEESWEVEPIAIAPRDSFELNGAGRNGVVVGLTAYFPPETEILSTDEIDIEGEIFEVEGIVATWQHPNAPLPQGVQVALRRAQG